MNLSPTGPPTLARLPQPPYTPMDGPETDGPDVGALHRHLLSHSASKGAHRSAAVGDPGALPSSALAGRVVDFVSRLQAHTGWSSDHILAVIAQVGGSVDAGAAGPKATAMSSSLHGDQEVAGGGGASGGAAAVAGAAGGLKQSPSMSKFHRRMRTPDWVDAEVQALNASALGGAPYDCDGSVVVGPGHATTLALDHVSVGVAAAGAPPSSVKGRAAAASTTAALHWDDAKLRQSTPVVPKRAAPPLSKTPTLPLRSVHRAPTSTVTATASATGAGAHGGASGGSGKSKTPTRPLGGGGHSSSSALHASGFSGAITPIVATARASGTPHGSAASSPSAAARKTPVKKGAAPARKTPSDGTVEAADHGGRRRPAPDADSSLLRSPSRPVLSQPPPSALVPMLSLSPRALGEEDSVTYPNPALAMDLKAVPRSPSAFSKASSTNMSGSFSSRSLL